MGIVPLSFNNVDLTPINNNDGHATFDDYDTHYEDAHEYWKLLTGYVCYDIARKSNLYDDHKHYKLCKGIATDILQQRIDAKLIK